MIFSSPHWHLPPSLSASALRGGLGFGAQSRLGRASLSWSSDHNQPARGRAAPGWLHCNRPGFGQDPQRWARGEQVRTPAGIRLGRA